MRVECANCGGIGAEFWLSLAALVLAIAAGWYAKRSADSADEAVSLAREEVKLAREEHDEFLRQLRARARFGIRLWTVPQPGEDDVIRADATVVGVRVEIELLNVGDRAAGETAVDVTAPQFARDLRWSGPRGEHRPGDNPPVDRRDVITDGEGRGHAAQHLLRTIHRVGRRSPVLMFVMFTVDVPPTGVTLVPLEVGVVADELPEDDPQVQRDLVIRIARPEPGDPT